MAGEAGDFLGQLIVAGGQGAGQGGLLGSTNNWMDAQY